MTDDFDVPLRRRLEALAAAVPVTRSGEVASVTPRRMRASSGSRLALGGLVPVVAFLVVGTLLAGIARIGPFASGTETPPSDRFGANGRVEATTRSGDFELTIRSATARYAVDERVDVEASLTYLGEAPVQIAHAMGANEGPMGFGIEEAILGDLHLTPTTQDACVRSTLEPGQPLTTAFEKSGGFSGDDPRVAEYRAFFEDPELRLTEGTWHIYAVGSFSVGDCSSQALSMRVDVEIVVEEAPDLSPSPRETSSVEPTVPARNGSALDQADDGTLEIGIFTPRSRVHAGDPVTIFTHYGYIGPRERARMHQAGPPVLFHLDQLNANAETTIGTELQAGPCSSTWLYSGDEAVAFGDVRLISGDGVTDEWLALHFDGSKLRLPVGVWRVTAFLLASTEACIAPDAPDLLRVSIEFEVAPADAGGIELLTATTPPPFNDECPVNAVSGTLAPNPVSGLGLILETGESLAIRWPYALSAEQGPEGAVLYDWNGFRFAVEGEQLNLSGALGPDGVFSMCVPAAIAL